jgi:hypothetical protein
MVRHMYGFVTGAFGTLIAPIEVDYSIRPSICFYA